MRKILYKVSDVIYRFLWKKAGYSFDEKLAKKFRLLYPVTPSELENMVDNYRRKQIGIFLLFLLAGVLFVLLAGSGGKNRDDIRIWRNDYGEGQKEASILLESGETITFAVEEKEYSEEELEQAFQESFVWIREQMLLNNKDAGEIRSDLNFMTEIPGGFTAEWVSLKPEILNHDGQVNNEEWLGDVKEDVIVELQVSYQEHIRSQELHFCIREPSYTAKEEIFLKIKQKILEKEQLSRQEDSFVIPRNIEGTNLELSEGNSIYGIYLLAGALFVFLFFYQGNRLEEEKKARHRQLEEDYPVLINKLVLYLGAGINLRKTFQQIIEEYREDIQKGRMKKRYLYEELNVMVNEMNAGAGEQKVYETFGNRMDHLYYTKLMSLLIQNLQKGNEGLLNALKTEETNAFFLRIDHAKRMAEEAGTRLLFPMLFMLIVVMAIVMAPALFQFGGI